MYRRIKSVIFIIVLCITSITVDAQAIYTAKDAEIFEQYITEFSVKKGLPIGELFVQTGLFFLNTPYVGATLENQEKEQLVVNLRELDCTTFVETCIALSLTLKEDSPTFQRYQDQLRKIRYRNGQIDGYTSRLHYPSDWVHGNSELFNNITLSLGGSIVDKPLNFMSSHSQLYPHLKDDKQNQEEIKKIETEINQRNNYTLLPVSKIRAVTKQVKTGDVIIFGTRTKGLDYSHIGFAYWHNGALKLLHASSARKQVVVDAKSLVQYCETSKTCTGITVLRIK